MLTLTPILLLSILGLLLASIQYYSFGLFILQRTLTIERPLVRFVLSWLLGICITSITVFLLGKVVGLNAYYVSLVFFGIGVFNLPHVYSELKVLLKSIKREPLFFSFLVLSAMTLYFTMAFSWIISGDTLYVQNGQLDDSTWHLALIQKLLQSLPPVHPSSYNYLVENYHYLYDISVAILVRFFKLPIHVLYFQVFPLIISFLLGCSMLLIFPLKKARLSAYLAVFFTFFGGSFAYMIPYFLPGNTWQESSFWVSQTFAVLVNPQLIFSFSILMAIIWYVWNRKSIQPKQQNIAFILITILTASLVGFKSYGWLLALLLIGLDFIEELFTERRFNNFLKKSVIFGLINFSVMYALVGLQSGSFKYLPLWYLNSMIESPDRVNNPLWKFLEIHYIANDKLLRLIELKTKEFLIFFSGNLGTRVLFILYPAMWFFSKKRSLNYFWIKITIVFVVAAALPLLVVQSSGPIWNSIQFWYYALIFANLLVATMIAQMLDKIRIMPLKVVIMLFIIVLTVPTFLRTVWMKYTKYERIPKSFVEGMRTEIQPEDRVFVCPNGTNLFGTSLASSLSGGQIYFANPVQLELMFKLKTEDAVRDLHKLISHESISSGAFEEFLKKEKINKVVCTGKDDSARVALLSKLSKNEYNGYYIFTYENK